MIHDTLLLLTAVAVDVFWGEPPARLHPVVWMGRCLDVVRRMTPAGPAIDFVRGAGVTLATATGFALGAAGLLWVTGGGWLWWPAAVWLLTSSFAIRGLASAATGVRDALRGGDLAAAREGLRSLCARRADGLDDAALCSATIESVAENLTDSVVAPLLFYAVAGVPGALAYRVVNTADAMIGYRGRFEYLGKAAAFADDVLNWIPARIAAALVVVAAPPSSRRASARAWWRDARRTESPNAGRTMAAMAGALGVRLEKDGHYVLHAAGAPPTRRNIDGALRVYGRASALAVALCAVIAGAIP